MMVRRRKKRKGIDVGKFGWTPRYLTTATYFSAGVLVVCLFAGAGLVDRYIRDSGSPFVAAVISAILVDYANQDRGVQELNGLMVNPKLVAAAQAKADDMAAKGYFSHTTPEGYDSWHWFKQVSYDYAYAGENLAVDFSESSDVEKAWMASASHRANILNSNYTEIGIAVATGTYQGRPTVFAVQMFGRPSAQEVARSVGAPPAAAEEATGGDALASLKASPQNQPPQVAGESTVAGILVYFVTPDKVPWWARLAVEPKQTLRYAYLIIGLLILLALFGDMEWELKKHHLRHAMKAGVALATMSMLFIVADWVFFAQPILAAVGQLVN